MQAGHSGTETWWPRQAQGGLVTLDKPGCRRQLKPVTVVAKKVSAGGWRLG